MIGHWVIGAQNREFGWLDGCPADSSLLPGNGKLAADLVETLITEHIASSHAIGTAAAVP
jgi:hypothetical protein